MPGISYYFNLFKKFQVIDHVPRNTVHGSQTPTANFDLKDPRSVFSSSPTKGPYLAATTTPQDSPLWALLNAKASGLSQVSVGGNVWRAMPLSPTPAWNDLQVNAPAPKLLDVFANWIGDGKVDDTPAGVLAAMPPTIAAGLDAGLAPFVCSAPGDNGVRPGNVHNDFRDTALIFLVDPATGASAGPAELPAEGEFHLAAVVGNRGDVAGGQYLTPPATIVESLAFVVAENAGARVNVPLPALSNLDVNSADATYQVYFLRKGEYEVVGFRLSVRSVFDSLLAAVAASGIDLGGRTPGQWVQDPATRLSASVMIRAAGETLPSFDETPLTDRRVGQKNLPRFSADLMTAPHPAAAAPLRIAAYGNCDDVVVCWRAEEPIPDCVGLTLERETIDEQGQAVRSYVENRTGFAGTPAQPGERRPSSEWPFQRFSWADHVMNAGDRVRYRVIPVIRSGSGPLILDAERASEWTQQLTLSGDSDPKFSFLFNRGLVISQFMSRYLRRLAQEAPGEKLEDTLKRFKDSLDEHETPIRVFLSGNLRASLVKRLAETCEGGGHVFAALYELGDDELLSRLEAYGGRAHVVLANGSVKKAGEDQNAGSRERLVGAGVETFNRMVSPKALGHNKFLVFCDQDRRPVSVWTGSTNWTKTGLCTQINNALHITDEPLARLYLEQWERLRDAESGFSPALVQTNSVPKTAKVGDSSVELWFTRTEHGQDMDVLRRVVNDAEEAVLFLMFSPGPKGLFKTVHEKMKANPALYVKGVVSDLPDLDDESSVNVTVVGTEGDKEVSLGVIQPKGINAPFASWAEEVTRKAFKENIGHAIVHSKVVVADPFTRPVVVTGSHNFSGSASTRNDENFVIVRDNPALAQAYAVHILSVYQHYRWRAYVAEKHGAGENPWGGLADGTGWQTNHFGEARLREMKFWVR